MGILFFNMLLKLQFDQYIAGWIMVNGQRIAGAHITSGMELPGPQHRYLLYTIVLGVLFGSSWKLKTFNLFGLQHYM